MNESPFFDSIPQVMMLHGHERIRETFTESHQAPFLF